MNRYLPWFTCTCLPLAMFVPTLAHAAQDGLCSIFPTTYIVGDKNSDSACTHNDIQSAINAVACPNTTIYVTQGHLYHGQHLLIQDTSVDIEGTNASDCTDFVNAGGNNQPPPTVPAITISGTGHSGDSVISIHGVSNVTLKYLHISEGRSDTDQFGGGIYTSGSGSLILSNDLITNNFAGYGGGMNINGDPGPLSVTLNQNTVVDLNTAQYDGGGIRIEGNASLALVQPASVLLNQALGVNPVNQDAVEGNGGGIVVYGPASADIAGGALSLFSNSARYGGGIAVLGTGTGDGGAKAAGARLFATDAAQPVGIDSNTASVEGGGIYMRPKIVTGDGSEAAKVCVDDFTMNGNIAPEGAAIYLDHDTFDFQVADYAYLSLNDDDACPLGTPGNRVACKAGDNCNAINQNMTENPDTQQATAGSIIYLNYFDQMTAKRFAMRGNNGARMITAIDNDSGYFVDSFIANCLIADNHTQHEIVHTQTDKGLLLRVDNCTIADNTIDDGYVFFAKGGFNLTRSIIWQPGESTIDYQANGCNNCEVTKQVVSNDISTFPPSAPGVQPITDPMFVDAAHGNYQLMAFIQAGLVKSSPAIDYTEAAGDIDLDDHPYDRDVPAVDHGGVRDLGAYEAQPIPDRIFGDGFGDPMSLLY
ncbi:MAG: hypothetical protein ACREPN_00140 [Rudaea sp.]